MTFSLLELSRFGGKPVHLFRFARGPLAWRYTSGDRPFTLGAEVFAPAAISRSAIRESAEEAKNNITITMPVDADVAGNWRPYPPSDIITIDCLSVHYGDADAAVEWTGRVLSPKFTDTTLTLTCDPSRRSGRRSGLQLKWQRGCPLALYSQGAGMCNVDKALHAVPATITNVTGLTLTAAAFGSATDGILAGGFVEWTRADGLQDFRTIMAHSGSTILVNYGASDLAAALQVIAYRGCAHNTAACAEFGNGPNYGGAKDLPTKDIFSGVPVW